MFQGKSYIVELPQNVSRLADGLDCLYYVSVRSLESATGTYGRPTFVPRHLLPLGLLIGSFFESEFGGSIFFPKRL
jgi:hypothetical protein